MTKHEPLEYETTRRQWIAHDSKQRSVELKSAIYEKLVGLYKSRGVESLTKLSEDCGIPLTTLYGYFEENMKLRREPILSHLKTLALYFETTTDYLLGLETNETRDPVQMSISSKTRLDKKAVDGLKRASAETIRVINLLLRNIDAGPELDILPILCSYLSLSEGIPESHKSVYKELVKTADMPLNKKIQFSALKDPSIPENENGDQAEAVILGLASYFCYKRLEQILPGLRKEYKKSKGPKLPPAKRRPSRKEGEQHGKSRKTR